MAKFNQDKGKIELSTEDKEVFKECNQGEMLQKRQEEYYNVKAHNKQWDIK